MKWVVRLLRRPMRWSRSIDACDYDDLVLVRRMASLLEAEENRRLLATAGKDAAS